MVEAALSRAEPFHGLASWRLTLPNGDKVRVLEQGAQIVSWEADGRERLYFSPRAHLDGCSAIRGGVPVCFPQFNQRGPLPKHGFVRNLAWTPALPIAGAAEGASLALVLRADAATRQYWPQAFEATLTVGLRPGSLQVTLDVRNTDAVPLHFSGALHTYLAVDSIAAVQLTGLEGQAEWDAVADRRAVASGSLRFAGEFDRVYAAAEDPLLLEDGGRGLRIEQSRSWTQTVVWNPGAQKCAALADMPADGYTRMLCVEAAQVDQPVVVAPGAAWQGWQRLSLA